MEWALAISMRGKWVLRRRKFALQLERSLGDVARGRLPPRWAEAYLDATSQIFAAAG
jgi:hypothetical protein